MFPFLYETPKDNKKDDFVQEQLYIEQSSDCTLPPPKPKEEKPKRGCVIIQL